MVDTITHSIAQAGQSDRTDTTKAQARDASLPFSAGPRVCTGVSFAMAEAVLLLARLPCEDALAPALGRLLAPMVHMTVRALDGIWLDMRTREGPQDTSTREETLRLP